MPHLGTTSAAPSVKPKKADDAAPATKEALPKPTAEAQKEQEQLENLAKTTADVDTGAGLAPKSEPSKAKKQAIAAKKVPAKSEEPEHPPIEALPPTTRTPPLPVLDAAESMPLAGPSPQPQINSRPLDSVLNMQSSDTNSTAASPTIYEQSKPPADTPKEQRDGKSNVFKKGEQPADQPLEVQKHPHISTPPYIHHFDTYGLVRRLEEGGWTQGQAIELMKAVRLILSSNMDLAQQGLVSKSNVENESYLFSAACSELRTEIQTKRKGEGERSRTERTGLSHEVDILGQRMTQESATMKDELKGMFDDRKMAVRNEQRDMERKVFRTPNPTHFPSFSITNKPTPPGPRTQLQNHSHAQLRLPLRRRNGPLDHHQTRNHRPRNLRRHDPRFHQIRLLRRSVGGRGKETTRRQPQEAQR